MGIQTVINGQTNPSQTVLYPQLCGNPGGTMPLGCSYTFTADDLMRISAWIANGAKVQ